MPKITFMGAGSTIFAKSILGDCLCSDTLNGSHIALYDIDAQRLEDSKLMMEALNSNINENRATITAHLGVENRKDALRDADFVVNAIQVGGYEPCTVTDFEVPKKYGLRQTIADTLGIGGIFRSLRTIPVMLDFARDMQEVCPDAWMLNYTNPMAMITSAMIRGGGIKTVGLCHSVQGCAGGLLKRVGMQDEVQDLRWKIAGINHQAWLLEIKDGKKDLYPEIKRRARKILDEIKSSGGGKALAEEIEKEDPDKPLWARGSAVFDMVRLEMMLQLGYYITESSEHFSEYCAWFIKKTHPELIDLYNIPLDEYPRRCVRQIEGWREQRKELVKNAELDHNRGHEFGSFIMEAILDNQPIRVHGNVMNTGLITNLPAKACVEVPCLVDMNGVQPCYVGDLPEQCAATNRTNVNVQVLTVEAALTGKRDYIYQAAMLDPLTATNLSIDEIHNLCDDLIEAHGDWLPKYEG
ncbi:MAG: alpha-glucosidase/alpha-galactosidase [Phycisphaerae bacterium]